MVASQFSIKLKIVHGKAIFLKRYHSEKETSAQKKNILNW